MSRAKGTRFEREVARALTAVDGPDPVLGTLASTTGRVGHPDLGADVYSRRLAAECKNRQDISVRLWDWLEHIQDRGHTRMLAIKRNHKPALVVMTLDDFLNLIGDE